MSATHTDLVCAICFENFDHDDKTPLQVFNYDYYVVNGIVLPMMSLVYTMRTLLLRRVRPSAVEQSWYDLFLTLFLKFARVESYPFPLPRSTLLSYLPESVCDGFSKGEFSYYFSISAPENTNRFQKK